MTYADMCAQATGSIGKFGRSSSDLKMLEHVKSPIFDRFSDDKFCSVHFEKTPVVDEYADKRILLIYQNITK